MGGGRGGDQPAPARAKRCSAASRRGGRDAEPTRLGEGVPADRTRLLGRGIGVCLEAAARGREGDGRHGERAADRPRGRTQREEPDPVAAQVDTACLEDRQQLTAGQHRRTQVPRCPDEVGQHAPPQPLRVHPGVRREVDQQPATEVGLLADPQTGLAEDRADGRLTSGGRCAEGAEQDRRQHHRAQHAVRAEAAARLRESPGDPIGGEVADRGERFLPDVAEDQHGRPADPGRQERGGLGEAVVAHAQHDQVEVVVGHEFLPQTYRPPLDHAPSPRAVSHIGQLEVDRVPVRRGATRADVELDLVPGPFQHPAVDRRDHTAAEHQDPHTAPPLIWRQSPLSHDMETISRCQRGREPYDSSRPRGPRIEPSPDTGRAPRPSEERVDATSVRPTGSGGRSIRASSARGGSTRSGSRTCRDTATVAKTRETANRMTQGRPDLGIRQHPDLCARSGCGSHDDGGAEGNRTPDLLDANETRYQLRYSPRCLRPALAG